MKIFNKSERVISRKLYINDKRIESVYQYTYLGVLFNLNGSFKRALIDLNARGQKAFFKLINIFKNTPCDIENSTYIVDHTVKKVILYASEILGIFDTRKCSENIFEQLFISVPIEKIDLSMCRYLQKVNRKTCKLSSNTNNVNKI